MMIVGKQHQQVWYSKPGYKSFFFYFESRRLPIIETRFRTKITKKGYMPHRRLRTNLLIIHGN
jgi:hypothetical protein